MLVKLLFRLLLLLYLIRAMVLLKLLRVVRLRRLFHLEGFVDSRLGDCVVVCGVFGISPLLVLFRLASARRLMLVERELIPW